MPNFELVCMSCREQAEQTCKFDEIDYKCKCGGILEIVIQPIQAIYKSKGFHSTDYPKPIRIRRRKDRTN
jgi:hypothetical protein